MLFQGQIHLFCLFCLGFVVNDNNAQKVQEVNRYATCYWKDIEKKTKKDTVIPEHEPFRWALEEFRVFLFAQHTKLLIPYRLNAWINVGMRQYRTSKVTKI
jgi:hypothetical protein